MGADIPKQFLPVGGKPVLMHTISRFHAYDKDLKVILVLPKEQQTYWKELCEQYHFDEEYQLADGGASRFQSCKNGISMIPTDAVGLVGIHDGVRPFVSCETIARCFDTAQTSKAVIPVLPVTDTLRFIGDSQAEETYSVATTKPYKRHRSSTSSLSNRHTNKKKVPILPMMQALLNDSDKW